MLMLWFFHMVNVAADWMVMPLCLSSSMESMVAPTPSFPFTCREEGPQLGTAHCDPLTWKHEASTGPAGTRRSPRESPLSCPCRRALARSGWSSPSRCEQRSRCFGSARWGRHRRSMSDSCWWAPGETTHRERQTDRETERQTERGSVLDPLHRSGLSSVQISSTFLTVTPLGARRCVWAKHRPAFKTLIVTTARSDHGWSSSSSSTTPRSHSSYKPVNVTLKPWWPLVRHYFRVYGNSDVQKSINVRVILIMNSATLQKNESKYTYDRSEVQFDIF